MKTTETLHEAELITSINGHPFVITGPAETVTELYEAAERDFNAQPVKDTTHVAKTAVGASMEAVDTTELTGRKATITAKLYDLAHGRNMYDLLKQQREDERDLAMARKLGLVTTVYCQRHERELAKVRGLR